MAYTENKSIDGLTAITPTIDDLVVTMDQAEVGVAKSSTLLSIYNLFKTTYDTVYAKYLGDADFYKYSIVPSVGNLIVNNSFETNLTGWNGWLSASFTRVTSQFFHGTASAQIVTDGSTYAQGCYSAVTTKVGSKYAYSCYVKGTAGKQISMLIDGGTYPEIYQTLTGGWDRITGSVTATSTNTSIYIQCRTAGVTTYWVDAVQVEEGTTVAGPFTTTQGNLTVALKNYEGNDPTPSKPVKIQIGDVVRSITSASNYVTYTTINSGTNYLNCGSSELSTKEIDFFTYIGWDSLSSVVRILASRIPNANYITDFVNSSTNEKGFLNGALNYTAGDSVVNIGRFNATLSAGGAYTWSIPATSVIINRPCYETIDLDLVPTLFGDAGSIGTFTANYEGKYRIRGNQVFFQYKIKCTNVGSWAGGVLVKLPFKPKSGLNEEAISGFVCAQGSNPVISGRGFPSIDGSNNRLVFLTGIDATALNWGTFVVNDHIRVQGFYNI